MPSPLDLGAPRKMPGSARPKDNFKSGFLLKQHFLGFLVVLDV